MGLFLRGAAAVLIAVILSLTLDGRRRDLGLILTIAVCAMVMLQGMTYLQSVLDFLKQLETIGNMNGTMTGILLKVTGIAMISEIVSLVCTDSGNASLGKALNVMATAVILWLSIPLFNNLLDLIQDILVEL